MSIEQMRAILEGVQGFAEKVTYWEWPIGESPALPFVCFFTNEDAEFAADNVTYYARTRFSVELYSKYRDPSLEALFEEAFRANDLFYSKEAVYLTDERCWETVYTI